MYLPRQASRHAFIGLLSKDVNLNEAAQNNNNNDLGVFEEVTLNQKERDYIK